MAYLEWKSELELGEPTMDATHREYAELLNRLEDAADDQFLGHLDAFIAHTEQHFADENDKMVATKLPPAGCHLHEHEQVLLIMKDVRGRVAAGEVYLGRVLAGEMGKWFENHAASMDRMLAYWLRVGEEGRAQLLAEAQAAQHAHACGAAAGACASHPGDAGPADETACHANACAHDHEAQHDHESQNNHEPQPVREVQHAHGESQASVANR